MNKKKLIIGLLIIIMIFALGVVYFFYRNDNNKLNEQEEEKINYDEITKKFSSYVITNKQAKLYQLEDNKYIQKGTVEKDIILPLDTEVELIFDENIGYFKIKDMNYFIYYTDVEIGQEIKNDDVYKNYIPFNDNATTVDNTKFYSQGKLAFTLEESINLPIIIKDNDFYYVEYANQLLGVKKDEVTTSYNLNSTSEIANSIAALNYHFFYDESNKNECQQVICHHVDQFRSHLNYLRDNGFYTLKMKDMELFVDGKIQLPKKSVLITIDDGWLAERGIALLNEYKMNATVFLITYHYLPDGFVSEYVEAHSHGDNLHFQGECPGGQGGPIRCYEEEKLLADLKASREKLNGSTVFCYPFYEYNDYAISILQKSGFTMAFVGGNRKIQVGDNKMILNRYPIVSSTTVNKLAQIVN